MNAPLFLTLDEVIVIHSNQLALYGGTAGIRDEGLLRSALAQPEASFGGQWLHDDLCSMAAAYGFHVIQNHPFIDGNKRVGAVCALHFLHLNQHTVQVADQMTYAAIILAVADGRASKADLADWFRQHLKPWRG